MKKLMKQMRHDDPETTLKYITKSNKEYSDSYKKAFEEPKPETPSPNELSKSSDEVIEELKKKISKLEEKINNTGMMYV